MGLRKVLLIIGGATFACLLICVAVGFFGLRSARNSVQHNIEHAVATTVADQVAAAPRTAGPMTLTVSELVLAEQLSQSFSDDDDIDVSANDIVINMIAPNMLVMGVRVDSRDVTYTMELRAENGKLVVETVDVNEGVVRWLLPGGKVGRGIAGGVNDTLFSQNLELRSVTVTDRSLVLEVVTGSTSS